MKRKDFATQESYISHLEATIRNTEKKLVETIELLVGIGRHHWGSLTQYDRISQYGGCDVRYDVSYKNLTNVERTRVDYRFLSISEDNNRRFRLWKIRRSCINV